jgi:hypothetical protein
VSPIGDLRREQNAAVAVIRLPQREQVEHGRGRRHRFLSAAYAGSVHEGCRLPGRTGQVPTRQ